MDKKVFLCGVLIGVATSTAVNILMLGPGRPPFGAPPPPWFSTEDEFVDRFSHRFGLSDDQKQRAAASIRTFHREVSAAHESEVSSLRTALTHLKDGIYGTLDESQQTQFDRMVVRMPAMHGPGRPPRRPPPLFGGPPDLPDDAENNTPPETSGK